MTISFTNLDYDFDYKTKRKAGLIIRSMIFDAKKRVGEISIIFCSDEKILEINRAYLEHDYYTDIITFDYCEDLKVSGELLISLDRVTENAESYGVTFRDELHRVIIHGVLHLLGYKDSTPEEVVEMRAAEDKYLLLLDEIMDIKRK